MPSEDSDALTRAEGEDLRLDLNTTDLSVALTVSTGSPDVASVTVSVRVNNAGPNPASSTFVEVSLAGPARWDPVTSPCRLVESTRARCEFAQIEAGQDWTSSLSADALGAGALVIEAAVGHSAGPDTSPEDNRATVSVVVGD